MDLAIFKFILLFCGLSLAQDNGSPTEVSNLLKELRALKEKLESQNNSPPPQQQGSTKVIFTATLNSGAAIGPHSVDTTLTYGNVITNIGNAYDSFTGIFTAPVAGVYHFIYFTHFGGKLRCQVSLFKNHQVIVTTNEHPSEYDTVDNGGNAVFLQLQPGDRVYVRLIAHGDVWGGTQTSFSGFLVSPL